MYTKFKNLLLASAVILGVVACSNDDEGNVSHAKPASLEVYLEIPSSRGIIEAPSGTTPRISAATVYVLSGTNVIAQKNFTDIANIPGEGSKSKVTFESISLSGQEEVVITANIVDPADSQQSQQEAIGRDISNIQPTTNKAGIANVYYSGKNKIQSSTNPGNEDGHQVYETKVILSALAARVEVSGKVKVNKELVVSHEVTVITPAKYSLKYGDTEKFIPENATDEGANNLWLDLASSDYVSIQPRDKVVANHLFAEDEQRIAFQMKTEIYDIMKNAEGKFMKFKGTASIKPDAGSPAEEQEINSYIFKAQNSDKYYVEFNKNYYAYTSTSATEGSIDPEPVTITRNTISQSGFFSMVKFHKGDYSDPLGELIDEGKYVGGKIYKINLGSIKWGDGDEYNPETDGPGTVTPGEAADLIVTAEVLDWVEENVTPEIE